MSLLLLFNQSLPGNPEGSVDDAGASDDTVAAVVLRTFVIGDDGTSTDAGAGSVLRTFTFVDDGTGTDAGAAAVLRAFAVVDDGTSADTGSAIVIPAGGFPPAEFRIPFHPSMPSIPSEG